MNKNINNLDLKLVNSINRSLNFPTLGIGRKKTKHHQVSSFLLQNHILPQNTFPVEPSLIQHPLEAHIFCINYSFKPFQVWLFSKYSISHLLNYFSCLQSLCISTWSPKHSQVHLYTYHCLNFWSLKWHQWADH